MTPRQLLDLLVMPLGLARPTSTLTVLQMLHIQDEQVTATDLECTVHVDLRADEALRGIDCCVDARRFQLALSTLNPTASVSIAQRDDALIVSAGGNRRRLPIVSSADFPMPESAELELRPVPEPAALARTIAFLQHAVAQNDLRPALKGMIAHQGALAGTDGFRVHHVEGAAQRAGLHDGAIIPRAPLERLLTLAEAAADEPEQQMLAGTAKAHNSDLQSYVAQFGRWTLRFQLIGAPPPALDRVVPKDHRPVRFRVRRQALAASCGNVARFAAKVPCGALSLRPGAGELVIELRDKLTATEEVTDRLPVHYEGSAAVEVGVNLAFMAQAAAALSGEEVLVSCANGNPDLRDALLLTGDDPTQRCVVMPMKL